MDALPLPIRATDAAGVEAARSRSRVWLRRGLLIAACAAAVVGSARLGAPPLYLEADPELARLLRAMALLKAAMIGAALAGLLWRFRWPVSLWLGTAYVAGAATTAGATVLIWNLVYLGAAAVLFHVGAAALIAGALLDRSGSYSPLAAARRDR